MSDKLCDYDFSNWSFIEDRSGSSVERFVKPGFSWTA